MSIFNFKKILMEGILFITALFVVVAFLEVILYAFDDFGLYVPSKYVVADSQGNRLFYGRPWRKLEFVQPIIRNHSGYPTYEFNKKDGRDIRVAIIGDSFLEALQVAHKDNFAVLAENKFKNVQLFPLGKSAQYLPLQFAFFKNAADKLFGPQGQYPDVNAYIFCVRSHGLKMVTMGTREYNISRPSLDIRYKIKKPFMKRLQGKIRSRMRSRIHSVSLIANRINLLMENDLDRALGAIDKKKLDWGQQVLTNEVLIPLLETAKRRNIPIGFLYIPSFEEVEIEEKYGEDATPEFKKRTTEILKRSGAPFIDATEYFIGDKDAYFKADKHINEKGHKILSVVLQKIIKKTLNLPSNS